VAEEAYCGSCGKQIPAAANFCKHCGADQAPFKVEDALPTATQPPTPAVAAPPPPAEPSPSAEPLPPTEPSPPAEPLSPPPPPPPSARQKAERVAPGAEELVGQLATHLQAPGVAMAGLSALIGLAVCLGTGLVLAIALPNASFLAVGGGSGLLSETLAQATSFTQANLNFDGGGAVRTVPVLFVLIPILGVAAGTAALAPRTAAMPVRERFLWAAAAGVPFAFLMLVLAVSLGKFEFDLFDSEMEFSAGSVFLVSLVWGALGGLLGMLFARRQAGEETPSPLTGAPARYADIAWSALRPLLLGLLAVGVLGTAVWVVQMVRDDDYREFPHRSTAVAVGEQLAYAGDHAVDILPLGAGASERLAGWPAVPISEEEFFDLPSSPAADSASDYNLFDFNDTMPAFLFVPMLIVLIAIPALLALYAGFAVARRVGERRADRAAAWGALVGPVWSIAMVLLATLARKDVVGNPTGDTVFIAFLLGGAVLGALGGLLAAQGGTPAAAASPSPPPPPVA
jgi:hypothetical protein